MTINNSQNPDNPHTEDAFALLSDNQWRFIAAMIEDPSRSKKDAAQHIGITVDTVYRWGKHVDEALEIARRESHKAAMMMRKHALVLAMRVKISGLQSEDESIKQKTATEIIEWELGKAGQALDLNHSGKIAFEWIEPDYEDNDIGLGAEHLEDD